MIELNNINWGAAFRQKPISLYPNKLRSGFGMDLLNTPKITAQDFKQFSPVVPNNNLYDGSSPSLYNTKKDLNIGYGTDAIRTPTIEDNISTLTPKTVGLQIDKIAPDNSEIKIPKDTVPATANKKGLSGNAVSAIVGAAGTVAGLAGNAILEGNRKKDYANGYGILYHDNNTDYKEGRLKSSIKYMGIGASLGSVVPGLGTAIGAGVGALAGFFIGKKGAKKKETIADQNYGNQTFNAAADYTRSSYANQLASMAKDGMKLKIGKAIKAGNDSLKEVGIKKNLIPAGVLHAHKNAIGDKGVPVVTKDGTKVLEIEKEEVIFTKDATNKIEWYINKFETTKDDEYLIKLGEFASKELLCNTIDNTDKFVEKGTVCNIK